MGPLRRALGRAALCLAGTQAALPCCGLLGWGRLPRRPPRPPGPSVRGAAPMQCEPWRMSRTELREVLNRYEKAVEEDALGLLRPSAAEKALLGVEALSRRAEAVRRARDANRKFVEAVIEDIPDLCALPKDDDVPQRPVC